MGSKKQILASCIEIANVTIGQQHRRAEPLMFDSQSSHWSSVISGLSMPQAVDQPLIFALLFAPPWKVFHSTSLTARVILSMCPFLANAQGSTNGSSTSDSSAKPTPPNLLVLKPLGVTVIPTMPSIRHHWLNRHVLGAPQKECHKKPFIGA